MLCPDLFTLISSNEATSHQLRTPIVANLPHSGLQVPPDIAQQFTQQQLRTLPNSDWHLQPLYSFLPSLGITVLQANYSRYVVDLNRALKPPFFGSFWSAVVPERTAFKQRIYKEGCLPSRAQVRSRIDQYYTPYHQKLTQLLNDAIAQHGKVYLLDLHSFMGLITDDVCLGNANGSTCSEHLIDSVADSFTQSGYGVVKNKVFTGGHITRHYGHQPNVEALQIELHYPMYLPSDQIAETQISETPTTGNGGHTPTKQIAKPLPIPQYQGPNFVNAQSKLQAVFSQLIENLS